MAARRLRSRAAINADRAPTSSSTRPRRAAAAPTSATIERTSPEETRQSIHLTVKAAPSKLREATSRRHAVHRQARGKKAIVDETSEDDEEDEEDDDDEADYDEEDAEGDDDDEIIVGRRAPPPDDEDAEGDDDVDMDDALPAPPPPAVKSRGNAKASAKAAEKEVPSVEAKEMAIADDASEDEELSELESQPSSSSDEEDLGGDDDVDADDMDDEEEEEELDSAGDDDTPMTGSPGGTPDLSKLTRRQRAAFETYEGELISLSNEAQKKKHLTAEEHAMRRAEMARRRKNLSEKRNEEEKRLQMDTINRLLKKQAPKRRGRKEVDADAAADEPAAASASAFATDNPDAEPDPDAPRASPLFVRYVQTARGSRAAAPVEWLAGPAGRVFEGRGVRGKAGLGNGAMVQEVA
ncbi:uncharacterized protein K452DRAFT_318839 [Aplosporella prunicola CBS 121167]|uniref:INO80 complex subunit B-like conserved region domain-containing protein n=1 Tax=Aplosporella prunicola CBS 121167 TaxID=1176127 RepID=A0A6A6BAD4_9PEZI|nr:uncharacterized protein K452DRAFT_318839 [Aplosporella prunicola CBS 121167]KAF2141169.1 hypothetical protein K452DRAFT_318839 [Aplosporella prunicola CBS 121167]